MAEGMKKLSLFIKSDLQHIMQLQLGMWQIILDFRFVHFFPKNDYLYLRRRQLLPFYLLGVLFNLFIRYNQIYPPTHTHKYLYINLRLI